MKKINGKGKYKVKMLPDLGMKVEIKKGFVKEFRIQWRLDIIYFS